MKKPVEHSIIVAILRFYNGTRQHSSEGHLIDSLNLSLDTRVPPLHIMDLSEKINHARTSRDVPPTPSDDYGLIEDRRSIVPVPHISVDGGVSTSNSASLLEAGANVFFGVAGGRCFPPRAKGKLSLHSFIPPVSRP